MRDLYYNIYYISQRLTIARYGFTALRERLHRHEKRPPERHRIAPFWRSISPMVYLSTPNFEAVKSRDLKPSNQRQHNANHNIITDI